MWNKSCHQAELFTVWQHTVTKWLSSVESATPFYKTITPLTQHKAHGLTLPQSPASFHQKKKNNLVFCMTWCLCSLVDTTVPQTFSTKFTTMKSLRWIFSIWGGSRLSRQKVDCLKEDSRIVLAWLGQKCISSVELPTLSLESKTYLLKQFTCLNSNFCHKIEKTLTTCGK